MEKAWIDVSHEYFYRGSCEIYAVKFIILFSFFTTAKDTRQCQKV